MQKSSGHKLGRVLTEKGFVTEENLSQMLAQQLGIPFVDLKNYNLNKDVAHKLSETQACRFRVLVLEEKDTDILVGMLDPTDLFIYDELSRVLRKEIKTAAVCEVWYWRRL